MTDYRYVMHCLMVEACTSSSESACAQQQQRQQQQFQFQHPEFKFDESLSMSHVVLFQSSLKSASLTYLLELFLSLEALPSLLFLLLLARNTDACVRVHELLNSLPGWAAYALGVRFETYDALREHISQQHQHLLPRDCDDYFREVFAACADSEDVKLGLLEKGQQFARETSRGLLARLLLVGGSDDDSATRECAAVKRCRAPNP